MNVSGAGDRCDSFFFLSCCNVLIFFISCAVSFHCHSCCLLKNKVQTHSSLLCLQSCRCLDGRNPARTRHRQLCSNGTPGRKVVAGITSPHRSHANQRVRGSKQSPHSELAQTELHVDLIKPIFQICETLADEDYVQK